jgi:hypothetical protein
MGIKGSESSITYCTSGCLGLFKQDLPADRPAHVTFLVLTEQPILIGIDADDNDAWQPNPLLRDSGVSQQDVVSLPIHRLQLSLYHDGRVQQVITV